MASMRTSSSSSSSSSLLPLLALLSILFFTCVSSCGPCTPKSPAPAPTPKKPTPTPPSLPPAPKKPEKCPRDTLKFGVCGSWLGLIKENIGAKPSEECCTLIAGVADLEAAVCLCTAIKANILGLVPVEVPVAISLLVSACGKKVPEGFVCG